MNKLLSITTFVLISFLFSCSNPKNVAKSNAFLHLKFLSEHTVPFNETYENTAIGGLSGIDYFAPENSYYLISDDRANKNHVRFYTAQIGINHFKIDTVIFSKVTFLKDRMGNYYPNSKEDPFHTPDPEALRYNPANNTFVWSSEGERIVNPKETVLENPSVTETDKNGNYIDTFSLPPQMIMHPNDYGPRKNGVFEGLTFDKDHKNLFVSVEEPLYQDGPRAGTGDSSAICRIIQFNIKTKKAVAQFAYRIDPVAYPPIVPSAFKVNGISDILWVEKNKMLVVERSYSTGRLKCTIKVFLADFSSAENINGVASIKDRNNLRTASKKLLLNTDNLNIFIDNIEGVTFGPTLPNGKKSLIFVADNNFNPLEQTQFLLFGLD